MRSVGEHFVPGYLPILSLRCETLYGERERQWQLYRRGRYVEFNLVWDRGTHFGFAIKRSYRSDPRACRPKCTGATAAPEPGTPEHALYTDFLVARGLAVSGMGTRPAAKAWQLIRRQLRIRTSRRPSSPAKRIFRGKLLHVVRDTVTLPERPPGHAGIHQAPRRRPSSPSLGTASCYGAQYRYPMGGDDRVSGRQSSTGAKPAGRGWRELKERDRLWARSWHTLGQMHRADCLRRRSNPHLSRQRPGAG